MKRISISVRIAICLALLSLCGVLIARLTNIFPDTRKLKLQSRIAICESLAINCSLLANRKDIKGIERNLNVFALRTDSVESAALRRADGELVIQVGNHGMHWRGRGDGRSTNTNIYVPITAYNEHWGNIEVAFTPLDGTGILYWISPFVKFAIFITLFNAILFIFWLRRVLVHLDPSRVMPQRVRSALDTLAEGLLVLDKRGRIMMANKAYEGAGNLTPFEGQQGEAGGVLGLVVPIRYALRGGSRWPRTAHAGQPREGHRGSQEATGRHERRAQRWPRLRRKLPDFCARAGERTPPSGRRALGAARAILRPRLALAALACPLLKTRWRAFSFHSYKNNRHCCRYPSSVLPLKTVIVINGISSMGGGVGCEENIST